MGRRVVVTGIGVLASNGSSAPAFWEAICSGKSGIAPITRFDTSAFDVTFAGEVKGFDPVALGMDKKDANRNDLCVQYAVCATFEAVRDAGLDMKATDPDRVGVIYGSGIGGILTFEEQHTRLLQKGPGRISPFFIPMMISDMTSGQISITFGARGPNYTTVSACSSAGHAIGDAFKTIRDGEADVMITGGAEAAVSPMSLGGFASMKALSRRNDAPEKASRPFDAERDGFVLGEGAGTLILEDLDHARARGAQVYAEVLGVGFTADAYHQTNPSAEGPARAMRLALKQAGRRPEEVGYINAHGTSTPIGDKNETAAIKAVFGDHAHHLAVSSTKSMAGHLLGASGAVESIACILAVRHGLVPPTINLEHPDPECDLDYVPHRARPMDVAVAMNNSFGFGGHNAVAIFGKYEA
ncbi:MAG: beta-ketoacyl-[acyl-carrier-protein] synthase II [Candidatus Latescibacteria bacterium]|nr:beta-ketoacyl-[acyl-carrier-protein] synthase II [Candidatus Latescibacterota bacterium]